MSRTYTKGKRAEKEAETRRRIVEAALALHGEVGPAATTVSMIAERAGVQRHTVYAHLPDDRSIFMACSGLFEAQQPLPSLELWAEINDPKVRLREVLAALYGWFAHNQAVLSHVLRDAELMPTLREVSNLRFGQPLERVFAALAEGLTEKERAALAVAMSFYTWRTLVRDAGLTIDAAVDLMVRSISAVGR